MPRPKGTFRDETGQSYWKWTVLQPVECPLSSTQRAQHWLCRCECGAERVVIGTSLRNGSSRSCGCAGPVGKSLDEHPGWKGGRVRSNRGYIRKKVNDGSTKDGYIGEHVFVMEKHLVRDDNRFENLELRASSHGRGQTVPDLLDWAHEIIRRYGEQQHG